MTRDEIESALYSYYNQWDLQDSIHRLQGIKDTYNRLFDTGSAINYNGMPHGTALGNPPLEAVCSAESKLTPLHWDYVAEKKNLEIIQRRNRLIEAALHKLKPVEEDFIHQRYMERMRFGQIADTFNYSVEWAKKKHGFIINKLLKELSK